MTASAAREAAPLARTFRALRRLNLVDLRGHFSVRLPGGRILITPRPDRGVPPPVLLTAEDLVTIDPTTGRHEGRWRAPQDEALHVAIYRARPDIQAVLYAQPLHVLAFAVTDADILPLTHGESDLVIPPLRRFGSGESIVSPDHASACAQALGERSILLLPGQGALFVGGSVAEASARCYQLEVLAKVDTVARQYPGVQRVEERDAMRVASQRAPADDYLTFFESVAGPDPLPAPLGAEESGALDEGELRARVASACHILFRAGLVEHLEHVSHRLPDRSSFLITPRGDMGKLRPSDLAKIDADGRWVAGPLAPPPFLWLHRDMFRARPDIDAIVHTHQRYARAYAIAGERLLPLYRAGARWLRQATPVYPVPDLIFDEEHRRGTLAALGSGYVVHERSHGTDFLAPTIEEATVAAIHYENAARLQHRARALGTPRALPGPVLEHLEREEPPDAAWWADYLASLDVVE